jgi:hypothetical protein
MHILTAIIISDFFPKSSQENAQDIHKSKDTKMNETTQVNSTYFPMSLVYLVQKTTPRFFIKAFRSFSLAVRVG